MNRMIRSGFRLAWGCIALLLGTTVTAQEPAKLRQALTFEHNFSVPSLAISTDGKRAFASDRMSAYNNPEKFRPELRVWDLKTGEKLFSIWGSVGLSTLRVAISPDGARLFTNNRDGKVSTLKVWDARTGKSLRTFAGEMKGTVNAIAVSPDSKHIVTGGEIWPDRKKHQRLPELLVWDVKTGKPIRSLDGHTDRVWNVAISPDGKRVASVSADKLVIVWELATGRKLHTLKGHTDQVFGCAFSPDGKQLASGAQDGKVIIWDTETGERVRTLDADKLTVHSVTFSPDGKHLATGGMDGGVRLWDAATGRLVAIGDRSRYAYVVKFTHDGQRLVSADYHHSVSVWELEK